MPYERKLLLTLAVMFLVALAFWNTMFIYPIKLFVVILHELSHGLAAELTGGEMIAIEISEQVGGVCYYRGGIELVVASAGYLGSMLWGGVILVISARTRWDNLLGMFIGLSLLVLSVLYIRNTFGLLFTAGFGLAMILICWFLKNQLVDLLMKFLGITSCLYVLADIKSDLIDRTGIGSDADAIAQMLGVPGLSVAIGVFWSVIAFVALFGFLKISAVGEGDAPAGTCEKRA
jgi:hypothetical protein